MEATNLKIGIIPNQFLRNDGTFDRERAIVLCGKFAGVCYDKEGFEHLENEPLSRTMKRVVMTLDNGHHSVYDHITLNLNLQNIPKILAMVINNEHQYTTSEKSARYTPVVRKEGSIITEQEEKLYNKWISIFEQKIQMRYGDIFSSAKIAKLAQENARYLVTVFMPTQMIYSTSLRQINYMASWMQEYSRKHNPEDEFERKLSQSMDRFYQELERNHILEEGLLKNEKQRKFSLFGKDLDKKEDHFGDVYSTKYKGSFAELAQAQRHRTLDYQMERLSTKEYFVPPILQDDQMLVEEWLQDIESVGHVSPQGELVMISEVGKYEDFILKSKERLCSAAQLEIMQQTKTTLTNYETTLVRNSHPLMEDITKYTHGARCTFPDFQCSSDCKFKEGKQLVRKI